MFKFLRKHRTVLFVLLAAILIALPFFGVGGSFFISSPHDTIAKVNGVKITQIQFDRLYNQILKQKTDLTPEQRKNLAQEVFQELIRQEVFSQEAERYGIRVSDQEVQMFLASLPAFQKDGKFDPRVYYHTVFRIFGTTPDDFEKDRKKDIAARKLNQLLASAVHIPDEMMSEVLKRRWEIETDPKKKKELKDNPETIRQELRNQEINQVFSDWLSQLNSKLKVQIVSENLRKRLAGIL